MVGCRVFGLKVIPDDRPRSAQGRLGGFGRWSYGGLDTVFVEAFFEIFHAGVVPWALLFKGCPKSLIFMFLFCCFDIFVFVI